MLASGREVFKRVMTGEARHGSFPELEMIIKMNTRRSGSQMGSKATANCPKIERNDCFASFATALGSYGSNARPHSGQRCSVRPLSE
jgi:hypothetical protein